MALSHDKRPSCSSFDMRDRLSLSELKIDIECTRLLCYLFRRFLTTPYQVEVLHEKLSELERRWQEMVVIYSGRPDPASNLLLQYDVLT
jgi:hypothetical protein